MKPENSKYFTPNYTKKKVKLVTCQHPGCNEIFEAMPHTRFCAYHKDASTRPKAIKEVESSLFIFEHNFQNTTLIERNCDCCKAPYRIDILPSTKQYPRFCELHRNEYKRILWREEHGQEK
jgi:hypothetical protein